MRSLFRSQAATTYRASLFRSATHAHPARTRLWAPPAFQVEAVRFGTKLKLRSLAVIGLRAYRPGG